MEKFTTCVSSLKVFPAVVICVEFATDKYCHLYSNSFVYIRVINCIILNILE